METVNQRVKLFFVDAKKMNQAEMRKELKIKSRSQTSNWLSNEEEVPDKVLLKMIRTYSDLNANWILRGEGSMLLTDSIETPIFKTEDPASPYQSPCSNPACLKEIEHLTGQIKDLHDQISELRADKVFFRNIYEELARKVGPPSENTHSGGVDKSRRAG